MNAHKYSQSLALQVNENQLPIVNQVSYFGKIRKTVKSLFSNDLQNKQKPSNEESEQIFEQIFTQKVNESEKNKSFNSPEEQSNLQNRQSQQYSEYSDVVIQMDGLEELQNYSQASIRVENDNIFLTTGNLGITKSQESSKSRAEKQSITSRNQSYVSNGPLYTPTLRSKAPSIQSKLSMDHQINPDSQEVELEEILNPFKQNLITLYKEDIHVYANERVRTNWRKLIFSIKFLSLQNELSQKTIKKQSLLFKGATMSSIQVPQFEEQTQQQSNLQTFKRLIISITLLYSFVWVPIRVAYDTYLEEQSKISIYKFDYFVDAVFILDLVSDTLIIQRDENGKILDYAFDQKYLRSMFIFNMAHSLPFEIFKEYFFIIKYIRFIRFQEMSQSLDHFYTQSLQIIGKLLKLNEKQQISLNEAGYCTLFFQTVYYILLISNVGCCGRQTYLNCFPLNIETYFDAHTFERLYINNLYFSVATFVTVGYGDVSATYFYDIMFVCVLMYVGPPLFANIVGNFKTQQVNFEEQEEKKKNNKMQIYEWLAKREKLLHSQLPQPLVRNIKEQINLREEHCFEKSLLFKGFLFQLPRQIKEKIVLNQSEEFLKQFKIFFHDISPDFIQELVPNLKLFVFPPGQIVVKSGKRPNGLYFLIKGKIGLSSHKKFECFRKLLKGSYFGDVLLLNKRSKINYIVIGKSKCAVCLQLSQEFIQDTRYRYQADYQKLSELTKMRQKVLQTLEKDYQKVEAKLTFSQIFFKNKINSQSNIINLNHSLNNEDSNRSELIRSRQQLDTSIKNLKIDQEEIPNQQKNGENKVTSKLFGSLFLQQQEEQHQQNQEAHSYRMISPTEVLTCEVSPIRKQLLKNNKNDDSNQEITKKKSLNGFSSGLESIKDDISHRLNLLTTNKILDPIDEEEINDNDKDKEQRINNTFQLVPFEDLMADQQYDLEPEPEKMPQFKQASSGKIDTVRSPDSVSSDHSESSLGADQVVEYQDSEDDSLNDSQDLDYCQHHNHNEENINMKSKILNDKFKLIMIRLTRIKNYFSFLLIENQIQLKKVLRAVIKNSVQDPGIRESIMKKHKKLSQFLK